MTLCIVIRTRDGVIGIGDSAVNAGAVKMSKTKLSIQALPYGHCFTLTSGLRSISDKFLTYAGVSLPSSNSRRLYEVANEYGIILRRARDEDAADLRRNHLEFDTHLLLGGRCTDDEVPTAFLIYPQGNWIEVATDTPFLTVGQSSYALPILRALLSAETPLAEATNAGILAVDAAAQSTINVRYPIDVAMMSCGSPGIVHQRLFEVDVEPLIVHWRNSQKRALETAPCTARWSPSLS